MPSRLIYIMVGVIFAALTAYFNPQPVATHVATDVMGHSELSVAQLPPEAQLVWRTIQTNGPFAYPKKDGEIFGNFEKQLPDQPRGYYRSYTVPTKGAHNRGPQRLVTGGRSKTKPDIVYYTPDHYKNFVVVKLGKIIDHSPDKP